MGQPEPGVSKSARFGGRSRFEAGVPPPPHLRGLSKHPPRSPQVVDYYKEACRALENSETASLLGKIQKDWKKLVQMKIYYFAAVAHVRAGVGLRGGEHPSLSALLTASERGWGGLNFVSESSPSRGEL